MNYAQCILLKLLNPSHFHSRFFCFRRLLLFVNYCYGWIADRISKFVLVNIAWFYVRTIVTSNNLNWSPTHIFLALIILIFLKDLYDPSWLCYKPKIAFRMRICGLLILVRDSCRPLKPIETLKLLKQYFTFVP